MASVFQVAQFFLASNPSLTISNLKIQKLCSYAQAVSVAYRGKRIFPEDIEMWELGPVIRPLYIKYRDYDSNPIPQEALNIEDFSSEERLILAGVNNEYSELFDPWGLCVQSHRDFPGIRGSNHVLTDTELALAFANNPLVKKLEASDKPVPYHGGNTISAKEFINALAS